LNLERSIDNLEKKLNRADPVIGTRNKTGLSMWKSRRIIPLDEWIEIRNTTYSLEYFPDDFDRVLQLIPDIKVVMKPEDLETWESDFYELMEYVKNPNYGRLKCFHCLLSPDIDDPIFIGINRLVAKGLNNGILQGDGIQYPCQVVNRFQCPFERNTVSGKDTPFDVEDLFRLHELAFAVEIALAKARKDDSEIRINNKVELLYTLTDRGILAKILEQGAEAPEVSEYVKDYLRENRAYILDYFMRITDLANTDELRFY